MGWMVGFGVPVVLMILPSLSFFVASPSYVKSKPKASWITGLARGIASTMERHSTSKFGVPAASFPSISVLVITTYWRETAIKEGFSDDPDAQLHMSAMWLLPHFILSGLAKAFNAIGQNEFFYAELPKSMSSVASTLQGLGLSVASLVSSFIVSAVRDFSGEKLRRVGFQATSTKGIMITITGFSHKSYGPCREEEKEDLTDDSFWLQLKNS
ncbi:hypothetical protein SADUNF_Sadunf18G0033200 [Salix dunnii]|uniref:Uncharacterized protein n=1 Tax=Salix dunnii TaxID=1413687 RepID=A0A835J3P1_9ROSI|nr:hypothetical protein SADUNF_Sadunf18G0033200 [Salix dunnii]